MNALLEALARLLGYAGDSGYVCADAFAHQPNHRHALRLAAPFLADYTLDRLEDQTPLSAATRVLDPATGSGVFLVGAYRRIVEASLSSGETRLPLDHLHKLMTENIFGVELNATACHLVAAVVEYKTKAMSAADHSEQLARAAAEAYAKQGASTLTQSRYLWHSRQMMASVLLKPRERMHWTLDRAFADADLVTAAAMAGYNSKEAM
ncbi:MAG TPA: DNA methyltransferase [Novosphingobium sp.]|nr:DNA methyltransferase [Novosphingobium sp.]